VDDGAAQNASVHPSVVIDCYGDKYHVAHLDPGDILECEIVRSGRNRCVVRARLVGCAPLVGCGA